MGLQQSKDELLYKRVNSGDIEAIKALRREGAGLEWTDKERKTPLIVACTSLELYNAAKTLIELGANVNAYSRGCNGGTPLHHAARRGLEQTVNLLLSHGANALEMNDEYQTPLDIARLKGHGNVVRAIEGRICFFSGWLRELHGPGFLDLLAPQLLSRRVWVVVLPCGSRNKRKPLRLEVAIYSNLEDSQPRTIIPLSKAKLEEPKFHQPDPVAIISHISKISKLWRKRRGIKHSQEAGRGTRIKLAPVHAVEKHLLRDFSNACNGVRQATTHPSFPVPIPPAGVYTVPTAPAATFPTPTAPASAQLSSEDEELAAAIKASLQSSPRPPSPDTNPPFTKSVYADMKSSGNQSSIPARVDQSRSDGGASAEISENSSCTICLDAAVEGACIPCGHMVGCMSCLKEIQGKMFGCPVCRSRIDQVVRIYAA
ncbi:putative E3 ubiquitin-protein ligase XBAT35 [Andrographis paniculata]|uniref:putative E3 ubiquitin-protein ligase XBAT35 n=1 Tax=Andrographis paniculata TaxID=175694 RepID=UPI0021E7633A|nr:putative E3 ubiquitin-protein ligase XBAT35 [Andrographis paniculata]